MNKKGFTLTELLMVVVILGILGGIALPKFSPQKEKAYIAEALGMLSAIRQAEEVYRSENGVYCAAGTGTSGTACPSGWNSLSLNDMNVDTSRPWVYSVSTSSSDTDYTVKAVRQNDATGTNNTKYITLTRAGVYGGDHPNRP